MHTHAAYTCGIHMHMHMLRSPRGSSALMSSLPRVRLSRLRATASTPWPVASGECPWPRLLVPMSSETSSAGSRAWVAHGCGIGGFGRTRKRLVASRIDDFGGASAAPRRGSRLWLQGGAAGLNQAAAALRWDPAGHRAQGGRPQGGRREPWPASSAAARTMLWPCWRAMALLISPWATLQSTCWVWSPEIASTSGVGGQWRASVSLRTAGTPSARGVGLP